MTEPKFKSYTLWIKWKNCGWKRNVTVLNLGWPASNPIAVLKKLIPFFAKDDKKNWMILPEDRVPKGYKEQPGCAYAPFTGQGKKTER